MSDSLLVTRYEAVAIVTMNRPAAMNALSLEMRSSIVAALDELGRDESVRAIVLTGAGTRAFTAGLDLKEVSSRAEGAFGGAYDALENDPVAAIDRCGKPVIAAVNGVAITGGLELALACDLMIASRAARFADTHVKVQVMPGWGLSQRLPRLIGIARAKQMSLTGAFIDAEMALAWGLVNEVTAVDALMPRALAIAGAIADHDPEMVARIRRMIDDGVALPLGEALALEASRARAFNATIDAASIDGRRQGLFASNRG
jgi:enoyl-CoA hydratase